MKVLFCETSLDIHLILLQKEVIALRRTKESAHCFEAESKGLVFHLISTQSREYISVKEPRGDDNHYWVTISDRAYQDLVRNNECGTRYGDSSKVKIHVSDDL